MFYRTRDDVQIGDTVRSYDFPDGYLTSGCYVEGVVESIEWYEGCERYKICVTARFWEGKREDITANPTYIYHVYPPVNGTPTLTGRVTNGVKKTMTKTKGTKGRRSPIPSPQQHRDRKNDHKRKPKYPTKDKGW